MIISILLFILAGFFNSIMDTILFHWSESYFADIINTKLQFFCNPVISWKNMYKNNDPIQGPKFFGSTTFFVWLTDLWHLCKGLMIVSICLGAIFYVKILNPWIDWFILLCSFTVTFQTFFGWVWLKKK